MNREKLAFLLYLAIAVAFFADAAIGRGAFFHYDTWMQNYAFRAWWFAELKQGHFATWCPGMFAGYPLFAETQTGPLFPLTFLFFLTLPAPFAFSWCVIVLFAVAGAGAHALVRRLGGALPGALTAGVAFELAGCLVTHVVHFNLLTGAALLPWALYFAAGLLRAVNTRDALGFALVVAGFFLGAHPYALIMAAVGTAVFVATFAATPIAAARGGLAIAGACALGAGMGAVQLLPAIDLLGRTPRGGAVDASFVTFGSFPPWAIASLANPDVAGTPVDGSFFGDVDWSHYAETCAYVGLLPLGLAVAAIALRRDRATFALASLASLSFVVMLGKYTIASRILEAIPVVQSTRLPARWALPFTLAIAALAGLGLDALVRESSTRRRAIAIGIGAALVIGLVAVAGRAGRDARIPPAELRAGAAWTRTLDTIQHRARTSWSRTAFTGFASLAILVAFARVAPARRRALAFAVPILVGVDLASWGFAFNPRVPPSFVTDPPPAVAALPSVAPRPRVFRQGVDEIWQRTPGAPRVDLFTPAWKGNERSYATGAWTLPPNSQLLYGVESGEGFTSLPPLQWLEWMGAPTSVGAILRPQLSEAQADLLALDAVVSTGSGIAGDRWEARQVAGDVWVSIHRQPLPRVRLATSWSVVPRRELLETVRSAEHDPRRGVLLESSPADLGPSSPAGEIIPLVSSENHPGDWSIAIPPDAKGVVVLAESYDPHWKAKGPNGESVPVFRADGLFVGFVAPGEAGEVRLTYEPSPVRQGSAASIASVFAVSALALRARRRRPGQGGTSISPTDGTKTSPISDTRLRWVLSPLVLSALLILHGIATNRGDWRGARAESSLTAAAARSWALEAEGAYHAGALATAAGLLQGILRARPRDATALYQLGLVRRDQGRADDARRSLSEALSIRPDLDAARRALSTLNETATGGGQDD